MRSLASSARQCRKRREDARRGKRSSCCFDPEIDAHSIVFRDALKKCTTHHLHHRSRARHITGGWKPVKAIHDKLGRIDSPPHTTKPSIIVEDHSKVTRLVFVSKPVAAIHGAQLRCKIRQRTVTQAHWMISVTPILACSLSSGPCRTSQATRYMSARTCNVGGTSPPHLSLAFEGIGVNGALRDCLCRRDHDPIQ